DGYRRQRTDRLAALDKTRKYGRITNVNVAQFSTHKTAQFSTITDRARSISPNNHKQPPSVATMTGIPPVPPGIDEIGIQYGETSTKWCERTAIRMSPPNGSDRIG
ncbi:hypothetical protein J7E83_03745, partial [Arthrobacter sp. ISL-48]|uniref:hypothetical protein n=1 Tax=Arthrobacter sp. ISL-48 TaxID=2819110 RepID=UPI001BEC4F75